MSEQETTMVTCACETEFDSAEEGMFSSIADRFVCEHCYCSDLDESSTVYVIFEQVEKYLIGDLFFITEYGDDTDLKVTREYKSTDAWRGHYNTSIIGFVTVLDGWTTGGWGDPIADRKALFNEWSASLISGDLVPPCPIVIILDPTSNLFSTAITVQVSATDVDTFNDYFTEEIDNLHKALS